MARPRPTPNAVVDVTMEGDDRQVARMLARLNTTLDPVSLGFWLDTKVDPWVRRRASERFAKEGDDVSGAWAPLKPATARFRQNHPQGPFPPFHPINKRTGELERYITQSDNEVRITTGSAHLIMPGTPPRGELKKKVTTAQAGKPYPKTVARPVMGLNERDLLAVLTDLSLFISVGQLI